MAHTLFGFGSISDYLGSVSYLPSNILYSDEYHETVHYSSIIQFQYVSLCFTLFQLILKFCGTKYEHTKVFITCSNFQQILVSNEKQLPV